MFPSLNDILVARSGRTQSWIRPCPRTRISYSPPPGHSSSAPSYGYQRRDQHYQPTHQGQSAARSHGRLARTGLPGICRAHRRGSSGSEIRYLLFGLAIVAGHGAGQVDARPPRLCRRALGIGDKRVGHALDVVADVGERDALAPQEGPHGPGDVQAAKVAFEDKRSNMVRLPVTSLA